MEFPACHSSGQPRSTTQNKATYDTTQALKRTLSLDCRKVRQPIVDLNLGTASQTLLLCATAAFDTFAGSLKPKEANAASTSLEVSAIAADLASDTRFSGLTYKQLVKIADSSKARAHRLLGHKLLNQHSLLSDECIHSVALRSLLGSALFHDCTQLSSRRLLGLGMLVDERAGGQRMVRTLVLAHQTFAIVPVITKPISSATHKIIIRRRWRLLLALQMVVLPHHCVDLPAHQCHGVSINWTWSWSSWSDVLWHR